MDQVPTLPASGEQRKLAHRQLHSRSTQLSSPCDASLCSTCVQGACVDLILRGYGLLAAGLIGPDQLVIAVQVAPPIFDDLSDRSPRARG